MAILRVKEAFSSLSDPTGHVYTPGELVDSSDPIVRGREAYFETVEDYVSAHRPLGHETASAAPGQRRSRRGRRSKREPESTEPESTEPESTEPESTEPESTEPESTEEQ